MTKSVKTAPYDRRGNLMHFPEEKPDTSAEQVPDEHGVRRHPPVPIDWRPIAPFTTTLRLRGYTRGRSAAFFVWQDGAGRTYPMFLADLHDLLISGARVEHGAVTGTWVEVKRGQNYGIRRHNTATTVRGEG